MSGRLFDLGQLNIRLPDTIIVDTNLVVAGIEFANRLPRLPSTPRARTFFGILRRQRTFGFLPPMVANKVFHLAIRDLFRSSLPNHQSDLARALPTRRRFDWNDLYKVKPELLDDMLPPLEQLRLLIDAERLQFLQPVDLFDFPDDSLWETELLRLVGRYHLDTNDAAILLDAQRAGITAIATLDADLRRAQLDFDVYTWLS